MFQLLMTKLEPRWLGDTKWILMRWNVKACSNVIDANPCKPICPFSEMAKKLPTTEIESFPRIALHFHFLDIFMDLLIWLIRANFSQPSDDWQADKMSQRHFMAMRKFWAEFSYVEPTGLHEHITTLHLGTIGTY